MERLPDEIRRQIAAASKAPPESLPPLHEVLEPRSAVCPSHGAYVSAGTRYTIGLGREVWTLCPACVADRAEAEREAAEVERQQRANARLEEMLGRAAIPVRFIGRN